MTKPPVAKVNVPPPPSKMKFLGALSEETNLVASNFEKEPRKWTDFNFKTTSEFRSLFKQMAAKMEISNKDLLIQAFHAWLEEAQRKERAAGDKDGERFAASIADQLRKLQQEERV